jgi:hypothetical protein
MLRSLVCFTNGAFKNQTARMCAGRLIFGGLEVRFAGVIELFYKNFNMLAIFLVDDVHDFTGHAGAQRFHYG